MSLKKIRIYSDPILREIAKPIEKFDEELAAFTEEMKVLMLEYDGVGLAAPQIGVSVSLAVIFYEEEFYVLVNPVIVSEEGKQRGQEGCLSFPGIFEDITRPEKVTVEALDLKGERVVIDAEGFLARAFCHEIDHLRGKLMIDHLSPIKKSMVRKRMRKLRKE